MGSLNYIVIIPALNPDKKMLELIKRIKAKTDYDIIVVNDGSDEEKKEIFEIAGKDAQVLKHPYNMGKGAAVKTAFRKIWENSFQADGIVIADADGQHRVEDIIKVCNELEGRQQIVLGSREFTGNVPFKSKFGNIITRVVFHMASGKKIFDTQTGLRAFSTDMIPYLLQVPGERYEYEMNVLLKCAADKVAIKEVPIETIYLEENKSSHFHAIKDSFRIYKDILKFACSSFVSFVVDYIAYAILIILTGGLSLSLNLLISNIAARLISASVNYHINKKYVFGKKDEGVKTAFQYFLLAAFILIMNTLLLNFIVTYLISNRFVAKIIVEITLFLISLFIQKFLIFRGTPGKEPKKNEA